MSKKKNKKREQQIQELCPGVELLTVDMQKKEKRGILSKALMEVLVVGGAMCGFLSCLDLDGGALLILAAYAVMALYFTNLFIYEKNWMKDLGYVIFLIAFVLFIFVFRTYINSGFYAMVNQFLDLVTDYYGASDVRVFEESLTNRSITVPLAAVAIGSIQIVILNIFLNSYMSVAWAVFYSLPIFVLPLFFRLEPDTGYLVMTVAGMLGVICQKGNRHFHSKKNSDSFEQVTKKKILSYRHSDRAGVLQIAFLLLFSLLICGVTMLVKPVEKFSYRYKNSSIKENVDEPLGNLIMYGFEALKNSANTGGLASGKLGNVSDVRFDGGTDLMVRFTPYSTDRIYLKSYVGESYSWDHWDRDEEGLYTSPVSGKSCGRMDIVNVGAVGDLVYYPYYTAYDFKMGKVMAGLSNADAQAFAEEGYDYKKYYSCYSVIYYPDSAYAEDSEYHETEATDTEASDYETVVSDYDMEISNQGELENDDTGSDEEDIYDKYMYVPEINKESIETFCENAGIKEGDSVSEEIQKITRYFEEKYPYTLHPGSTPSDEDYVNYFLNTTKKGLCANYATTGALVLRYLGVPTRYVEGYVIDYEDVLEGSVLDDTVDEENLLNDMYFDYQEEVDTYGSWDFSYDKYFSGESELGKTAVVQVDVTDSSAHAWVEAYIDGKWQVVEFTPPSNEDDEDYEDFWTKFGKLLAGNSDDDDDETGTTIDISFSLSENMWVVYLIAGIVLCVILFFVLRVVIRKLIRILSYHSREEVENIVAYYRYMCNYMRGAKPEFSKAASHKEQISIICPDMPGSDVEELAATMEKLTYSGTEEKSQDGLMEKLRSMLKKQKRTLPIYVRIHLFMKY